jgi:AcrR family transcriptional regulator
MLDSKEVRGTKERVLEAALDEFADYGLAGARVDRIARRADINKAMIYYHFDSKEALYDHVLKAHMEGAVMTLTAEIAEDLPLEEILRIIAEYHRRGFESADKFSRIVLREFAAGSESIKRVLPELAGKENLRRLIVRKIEEGKHEGKYRDIDIRQTMIAFVGMSLFYLMIAPMANQVWGIEDDSEFKNQRSDAIVDLFMRGLEAR